MIAIEDKDIRYMKRALELAEKGKGFTNPNPMVGAVIVKDDRIIAEGWHRKYGELHAERNALAACTEDPAGATMYVTLEPCCHYGKTPPCTEAIIGAGIGKVVAAMKDPNPKVAGKGMSILENAGIQTLCGVCGEEAAFLNRVFIKYMQEGRPWITLKAAMTLDGKIAAYTGDSRWISCSQSREHAHGLRATHSGILAGIGTVLADDPMLNCRLDREVRQPVRIIADSRASIPADSAIVRTAREYPTIVAHTAEAPKENLQRLESLGIRLMECRSQDGRISPVSLAEEIGKAGIDSILAEGGGNLNFSLLEAGLVDETYFYIAPKMIGGKDSPTPAEGKGFPKMQDAVRFRNIETGCIGDDCLIHSLAVR